MRITCSFPPTGGGKTIGGLVSCRVRSDLEWLVGLFRGRLMGPNGGSTPTVQLIVRAPLIRVLATTSGSKALANVLVETCGVRVVVSLWLLALTRNGVLR